MQTQTTTLQAAEFQERQNTLRQRIDSWRQIQSSYMPTISQSQISELDTTATPPEKICLFLPSQIPPSPEIIGLREKEERLRLAQADDALTELKRLLRITMGLWTYKWQQLGPSQRANTRARALISRYKEKVNRTADRYRAARVALLNLDPNGNWLVRLRELKPEDIKLPRKEDPNEGEGKFEVSWIWMVQREAGPTGTDISSTEVGDSKYILCHLINFHEFQGVCYNTNALPGLRVEWARSRARAARWTEEVELLNEEMRRVLAYLKWKAHWWEQQSARRAVRSSLREGLSAYAEKQAMILRRMHMKFSEMWLPELLGNNIEPGWSICRE